MKKIISNLSLLIALISVAGCGDGAKNNAESSVDSLETNTAPEQPKDIVLYNIPSPIETFTILKMAGPGFDKSLTNPVANESKYVSNFSKAVNLGVYSTDLSFCFLYKQNQEFNNYLKSVNNLTNALGIDGSYGQSITKRMQDNSSNLDSLMAIATEASVNADLYLKENQRTNTTALIAAGSWIEAMHIITSIAVKKDNSLLSGLVADQKVIAKNVSKMLEQFESDAETAALSKDVKEIAALYDGLQPVQGNSLEGEDKTMKSIGNNTTYELSKDQLKQILDKVEALRNKLTN
jgi:predicted small lipoprotein YifL